MPNKLAFFLITVPAFIGLVAFHVIGARLLSVRRDGALPRRAKKIYWVLAAAVILALDLPLAHVFLLYKLYNPLYLDLLLKQFSALLLIAHANALVICGWMIFSRFAVEPTRRFVGRRNPAHTPKPVIVKSLPIPAEPGIAVPQSTRLVIPRRRFIQTAALAATGYVTSASTLSAMDATGNAKLERIVVKIPNLPEGLKGTTIAMIADIHSSVFMDREQMERYKRELNSLKADMIFVVGDFVNSKLVEVYPFAEAFSGLSAPMGVYGVTGNHDYYSGKIEEVVREVEQAGIKVLRNENVVLQKNGEKLWLLGIDDDIIYDVNPYLETGKTPHGTIENMMHGVPEHGTKLFLCHKPYPFDEYSQLGMDVMFSGHTHGGQVVLAQMDNVNLSFASLASKYVSGLYRSRTNTRSQLYVTRGVGTVGIPIRVNCPPEITHFVLV